MSIKGTFSRKGLVAATTLALHINCSPRVANFSRFSLAAMGRGCQPFKVAGRAIPAAALAVSVALSGCAGLGGFATQGGRNAQLVASGLIVVDTLQTITIARNPDCLREANGLAAKIIGGEHPDEKLVVGVNGLMLIGHWLFGSWLDRKNAKREEETVYRLNARGKLEGDRVNGWKLAQGAYLSGVIGGHGMAVIGNVSEGIGLAGNHGC